MIPADISELIGQRLRKQRETRRITLEDAAASLRIRLRYVEAMDKGDFTVFPSPAQARGFLRSYVQYLSLDAEPYMAALNGDPSLLEQNGLASQARADLDGRPRGDQQAEIDTLPGESSQPGGAARGPEDGISAYGDGASAAVPADLLQAAGDGRPAAETFPQDARASAAGGRSEPAARYPQTKFELIGQTLRRQRETLGLSLSDIERHTRLRAFYLKALEAGDLEGLPSPVQGRGMLKNYASFLGMDADALLLQFAEGLQARLATRPGIRILKRSGRADLYAPMGSPRTRLFTTDLLLAGVLVMFLIAFVAWGVIRITAMRASLLPTATAPAIADVLALAGTPQHTPLAPGSVPITSTVEVATEGAGQLQAVPTGGGELIPSPTLPPEFSSASVQVIVSVVMRAWMRVTVDGKIEFEGRVLPGSAFPFAGNDRVEVLTGNGAGLQINFNQTNLGALGTFGEAVQRVFTIQGMQTPTATITRTPAPVTITPTLTPTP